MTKKEARIHKTRFASVGVHANLELYASIQVQWCIDSFVLRNPPLRQSPKRYLQA
jgi:hypothetical protein